MNEKMYMNENQRGQLLEYNYAQIELDTGKCIAVFTSSYQIPDVVLDCIEIPVYDIVYRGKYYHDGHWFADADFTVPCPELDW